jgi:uncharacterized membrane protein YhfC
MVIKLVYIFVLLADNNTGNAKEFLFVNNKLMSSSKLFVRTASSIQNATANITHVDTQSAQIHITLTVFVTVRQRCERIQTG